MTNHMIDVIFLVASLSTNDCSCLSTTILVCGVAPKSVEHIGHFDSILLISDVYRHTLQTNTNNNNSEIRI